MLYAVSHALRLYFSELKKTGTYGAAAERMITFDQFNEIVGLGRIIEAERRYDVRGGDSFGR